MIRRAIAAALLVVSLTAARAGDDAPPVPPPAAERPIADEFIEAFRAHDDAAMSALATKTLAQPCWDPFFVAYELLRVHAEAALADPPKSDDALEAALALAERVRSRPRNAALPDIVDHWRGLTADELRREARVRLAARQVETGIHHGEFAACAADAARTEKFELMREEWFARDGHK